MPAHPPLTDPDVTDGCSSGTRVPRIWALFFTEFAAARNDASGTSRTSRHISGISDHGVEADIGFRDRRFRSWRGG
jgi:hypothetical protein